MVVEQRQNNMKKGPFKMKGFTYPGTAPLKKNIATARNSQITPDAVLMEAADLMGRGIDEPTSIGGMAALGLVQGFSLIKPSTQSQEDKDKQKEEKATKKAAKKAERKQKKTERIRRKGEEAWAKDDERRKEINRNRRETITTDPVEVNEIGEEEVDNKPIITRVIRKKKKKKKNKN